ncbi:MAG: S9 family peptidase, partial [Saprospiraceae bacterium]|nr:S9 family peptidase [Saprospiraceae bacterium]
MKNLLVVLFIMFSYTFYGQEDLSYQLPSQSILELADANLPPSLRLNTNADKGVLMYRKSYKSIEELSEPEMRLAGLRINPKTNISSRQRYYYDLTMYNPADNKETSIEGLPANGKYSNFSWSHDESMMAFTNTTSKGVELWVLDMDNSTAKKLTEDKLNGNMGRPFYWLKGDQALLIKVLPEDRQPLIDKGNVVPGGPTISTNDGKKAQNRTYQDLLKNKNDEFNFDQLAHCELWKLNMDGSMTQWMDKAIYSSVSFSPNGEYVMITKVKKPYSYLVPYRRFPSATDIYDIDGNHIKNMLDLPLIEDLPKGFMSVRTGPRSISWRADKP